MPHTFLLAVHKGPADWLTGFDVFRVTLSIPQIVQYVDMMTEVAAIQKRYPAWQLYEFRIWDAPGEWCRGNYDVDMVEDVEGNEVPVPYLVQDEDAARTELDIAHVAHDGITWTAQPKYSEREVSTTTLPRDVLEQLIRKAALQTAEKED